MHTAISNSRPDRYRFTFQGQESDNELKGQGNSLDFGARIYDPRLGRWLSLDPESQEYPSLTPYSFVNNMVLNATDPDGKRIRLVNQEAFVAFRSLLNSFGNSQAVNAGFNLRINAQTGIVTAADPEALDRRTFNRRLRSQGIRLRRPLRNEAYSTYLAIMDSEEIQIEIIEAGTSSNTRTPGTPGTQNQGTDNSLNANPGLNQMKGDITNNGSATQRIVNDAVRPAGGADTGPYRPTEVGNDFAVYDAPANNDQDNRQSGSSSGNSRGGNVKETIVIDGTQRTPAQNARTLIRAFTRTQN